MRLLDSTNQHRQLALLNQNDLFENYIHIPEFIYYAHRAVRCSMYYKNIVRYAITIVQSTAHQKCTSQSEKEAKCNNYSTLSYAHYITGDIEKSVAAMKKSTELAFKFNYQSQLTILYQNYIALYNYLYYDHSEYYNICYKINDTYDFVVPLLHNMRTPNKKIRVGYVSSDFVYTHVVSRFILPILKNFDPEKFEIYLYYNHKNLDDAYKNMNTKKYNILTMSDSEGADMIYQHNIDILIDLNGNSLGNRLGIFRLKPAPIQITYIGYPNTTGLKEIQYKITDSVADHPDSIQKYTEKLIRMPRYFLLYDPPDSNYVIPHKVTLQPKIVLGALNREAKNTKCVLEQWRQILNSCENSMILIKLESLDNVEARAKYYMKHLDIDRSRIILISKTHDTAYMDLFKQIDIFIDTFPYSGTTTTCNALYNSIPVVTLYNKDYHANNVSASLLKATGVPELIAYSLDEYVNIVKGLINDPPRIDVYKKTIGSKFKLAMEPTKFMGEYEGVLTSLYETIQ